MTRKVAASDSGTGEGFTRVDSGKDQTMTAAAAPIETVKAFLKALEALDCDTATRYLAPDCGYTNPPPLGTVHGPGAVRTVLEPFFASTLENEFRVLCESATSATVFFGAARSAPARRQAGRVARDWRLRGSGRSHHLLA